VLGVLLMSGVVLFVAWSLVARSSRLRCRVVVWQMVLYLLVCFFVFLVKSSRFLTLGSMTHLLFWAAPGMAAAFIRNELVARGTSSRGSR
jgi:hypothetical protein